MKKIIVNDNENTIIDVSAHECCICEEFISKIDVVLKCNTCQSYICTVFVSTRMLQRK